jgi:elongator complex protein 3
MNTPTQKIIIKLSNSTVKSRQILFNINKQISKEFKVEPISNTVLLKTYHNLVESCKIAADPQIENILKTRGVRSLSGIVVVSVLTKHYTCPGNCLYCPTEKNLPKSYVEMEPAVMRAQANSFDPYKQTFSRLKALKLTGHNIQKINLRIIGGTWSYYPKRYQTWFIKRCFEACNNFSGSRSKNSSIIKAQKINETSKCRLVEISVETRQDYINLAEIKRLRQLGVTKVELGIQSIYEDVLKLNRRGHNLESSVQATKLLKNAGFKVAYQIMLNLPGSNYNRDLKMLKTIFLDERFQPDYLKIYPLALLRETGVYKLYKQNKYCPYDLNTLTNLLIDIKKNIPPYVRIERIIRDIPPNIIIEGGAKTTNLRQIIKDRLVKENLACQCIRCREVKLIQGKLKTVLIRREYKSSFGKEIFLSIEDKKQKTLYALLRLRISNNDLKYLKNAALVREIHTYGEALEIGTTIKSAAQHRGFGAKLLKEAENIAKSEFHLSKMAVIAGIGAREYFRKFNYKLKNTYMFKLLS